MNIGAITLKSAFTLAPLAGYTDIAFRLLCREQGAALCFSEMISCHGLVYGQKKTLEMLKTVPGERPVAFQIFGHDPHVMGAAAAILDTHPVDIIDINMGCPVRKVTRKGSGAALMKNFALAEEILRSVRRNTSLPVTVKFRSGWNSESLVAADFAVMAQDAGVSAVTVHGRTWAQGFGGRADRDVIARVRQSVSIPVIGNGDILSYQDGLSMMAETGCDAVMIGRGALGNPWVFQETGRPHTFAGRRPVLLRHLELVKKYLPERKILFRIKNHASRYLAGLPDAGRMRKQITDAATLDEIFAVVNRVD
jgi:nifR3 family TIM-barrel protein